MTIWILIAILAVGLLLLAVVMQGAKTQTGKPKRRGSNRVGSVDREFVARKWAGIEGAVQGGGSLRDAVSEADKLVDYVMRQQGVRGETMGERLRHGGSRFSDVNSIWSAHKLRNALAHEAEFDLVPSQAKEAIASFERGLKDLGAL